MSELLTRHRFTVEEYHRMARILPEDNRLEMINGRNERPRVPG
jgi:hypothetical protein